MKEYNCIHAIHKIVNSFPFRNMAKYMNFILNTKVKYAEAYTAIYSIILFTGHFTNMAKFMNFILNTKVKYAEAYTANYRSYCSLGTYCPIFKISQVDVSFFCSLF